MSQVTEVREVREVRENVIEAADTTALSVTAFCAFVRQFSPLDPHAGRVEEGHAGPLR